jgi:hypothetical protein
MNHRLWITISKFISNKKHKMKHPILMGTGEPTDEELPNLMKEVAQIAKEKAMVTKNEKEKRITLGIQLADEKYKATKK